MSESIIALNKKIILINKLLIKKFGIPKRQNPLPQPLNLLIATILSQNTNDNNSYKAYQALKNRFKSWEELLLRKELEIEKVIRVAGLAKQKSEAIKNIIVELNKNGEISLNFLKEMDNEGVLVKLTGYKGIGVKTASCVLLFALDRNVCPVDTHVHRTVNRIGIVNEKTPDKTFKKLNMSFPDGIAHSFHTNLIRLGREICKPSFPVCGNCPLQKICEYPNKNFNKTRTSGTKDFLLLDNVD